MINFSNRGQDLILKSGESFILIDGLYLNSVKRKFDSLKTEDLLNEIRSKIFSFPYTDIPFASFYMSDELFSINKIIKVNYDDIVENEKEKCFSTDTGLLILILSNLIENFIKKYDYEDLVGSPIQPVNLEYWIDITNEISQNEIGLILSPGMHSGFEFEGSGTYKVDL